MPVKISGDDIKDGAVTDVNMIDAEVYTHIHIGVTGVSGTTGTGIGPTGPTGPAGTNGGGGGGGGGGSTGSTGAAGDPGSTGDGGPLGTAGPGGDVGPPGSAGPPGNAGPPGQGFATGFNVSASGGNWSGGGSTTFDVRAGQSVIVSYSGNGSGHTIVPKQPWDMSGSGTITITAPSSSKSVTTGRNNMEGVIVLTNVAAGSCTVSLAGIVSALNVSWSGSATVRIVVI